MGRPRSRNRSYTRELTNVTRGPVEASMVLHTGLSSLHPDPWVDERGENTMAVDASLARIVKRHLNGTIALPCTRVVTAFQLSLGCRWTPLRCASLTSDDRVARSKNRRHRLLASAHHVVERPETMCLDRLRLGRGRTDERRHSGAERVTESALTASS
jgi:hypothetical protein